MADDTEKRHLSIALKVVLAVAAVGLIVIVPFYFSKPLSKAALPAPVNAPTAAPPAAPPAPPRRGSMTEGSQAPSAPTRQTARAKPSLPEPPPRPAVSSTGFGASAPPPSSDQTKEQAQQEALREMADELDREAAAAAQSGKTRGPATSDNGASANGTSGKEAGANGSAANGSTESLTSQFKPGSAAASASASNPAQPKDFYNATFSPVAQGTNNELIDQQQTTVDFYIGPEIAATSAVPSENASVSDQIESQGKQNLTITLSCSFCSGSRLLKSVIAYSPGTKSTDATFKIVPDRRYSDRSQEDLIFAVTGPGGIVYDNVVVPVSIAASAPNLEQSSLKTRGAAPATKAVHNSVNLSSPPGARPVDLTITIASKDNRIVVQVDPENASLAKLFAGKALQSAKGSAPCVQAAPGCVVREFQTGLTPAALSQELREDYLSLASVVSQDSSLYQLLEGGSTSLPSLSGATNLSPTEETALVQEIHDDGSLLYQHLFESSEADPDLGTLLRTLDGYNSPDDKPLLVRIEEQSVYLPWQFLYPPSAQMDPQKFWGFRYEIVVDPEGRLTPGYLPGPLQYGSTGSTVFGKYNAGGNDTQSSDDISREGDAYATMLTGLGFANLKTDQSKADFLGDLQNNHTSLGVVAVFTHATNDLPQTQGSATLSGPEIFFAQNDFVTVRDLQKLSLNLPTTELFFKRPLVFLNGCETGTAGSIATGAWNFPSTFLDMGARGVIATEAPVWPAFAYDFGSSMMNALKTSNQPVSLVLLETRQNFLQKNHNPLGLLYTYYGGVDAALILP